MLSDLQCGHPAAPGAPPEPPGWVGALLGRGVVGFRAEPDGLELRLLARGRFALASARVRGALALDEGAFRERAVAAYARIRETLAPLRARQVVRMWNFIPRILGPLGRFPQRYMAFNDARYRALAAWERGDSAPGSVIAASGVGHDGDDLVVHALATIGGGRAVENPRQVAAYRYSARYGSLPPCFARATLVPAAPRRHWLLVSGTASVRGEDSMHAGDLHGQAYETLDNLSSLVGAARAAVGQTDGDQELAQDGLARGDGCLWRFRHLRVYYVEAARREEVAAVVGRAFRRALTLEVVRADLCRPELLVEIEGLAELGG